MSAASKIADHYSQGGLLARLEASLREDGVDPANPTIEELAPYDHFHGRGLEGRQLWARGVLRGCRAGSLVGRFSMHSTPPLQHATSMLVRYASTPTGVHGGGEGAAAGGPGGGGE